MVVNSAGRIISCDVLLLRAGIVMFEAGRSVRLMMSESHE
jgi:hypothetical protein